MNKKIEKYYMGHINENHAKDFIKEALAIGIRCDNVGLVRLTAGKMPKQEAFYGYSSPLEFAIKEMASDEVIKDLVEAGCKLSKPYHYLTPFSGSPQKLMELWMKTNGKTREEALQILANDISYFFHVIKTDYSCYRIPYEIDSEDKHKPCFWNYLDEWMSDFIKLLADESGLGIMDSCFGRCIIENVELRKSFDTFFELSKQASDQDDLIWYINIAVNTDNEHAFAELIEYMPSLLKEVDCYPATSKKILSTIFDAGLLAPGTDEGFNAFIPFISYGKPNKDILCSIIHPSYSTRTIEDGVTPLMVAVENEDFPAELYKLLITSPDDINLQDGEGRTALHYMAKTDHPECIEDLLDLGADPFIADAKGNNVLHILSENSGGLSLDVLDKCISLIPKKLLTMENNNGMTPTDMLLKN